MLSCNLLGWGLHSVLLRVAPMCYQDSSIFWSCVTYVDKPQQQLSIVQNTELDWLQSCAVARFQIGLVMDWLVARSQIEFVLEWLIGWELYKTGFLLVEKDPDVIGCLRLGFVFCAINRLGCK